jgi:hypothetical protein
MRQPDHFGTSPILSKHTFLFTHRSQHDTLISAKMCSPRSTEHLLSPMAARTHGTLDSQSWVVNRDAVALGILDAGINLQFRVFWGLKRSEPLMKPAFAN